MELTDCCYKPHICFFSFSFSSSSQEEMEGAPWPFGGLAKSFSSFSSSVTRKKYVLDSQLNHPWCEELIHSLKSVCLVLLIFLHQIQCDTTGEMTVVMATDKLPSNTAFRSWLERPTVKKKCGIRRNTAVGVMKYQFFNQWWSGLCDLFKRISEKTTGSPGISQCSEMRGVFFKFPSQDLLKQSTLSVHPACQP